MTSSGLSWHRALVRLGRTRSQALITLFSVAASVAFTAVAFVLFEGAPEDRPAYFVPAVLIPMVVAPIASGWVLQVAFALDAALQQVAEQAGQLDAVLSTTTASIAHLGPDGRVRLANASARALLRPDATGAVDWRAIFTSDIECSAFLAALATCSAMPNGTWSWLDAEGRTRRVRGHLAPLAGTPASPGGSVFLGEDVTELSLLEAQAARAQHLELASRLAGGMAHDFNNVLAIIGASAAALARHAAAPGPELEAIDAAAARGARLTRRLLAISQRNLHTPEVQPIGPLLEETVALVRGSIRPGIHLVLGDVPQDAAALMDGDAIELAIINIVMNAQDALGGTGVIRIAAEVRGGDDGRDWLVVSVHDNGPGMSPDILARATEPFFTTKPPHLGTGLGLSIVTDTMERHDGRLSLDSRTGDGTEVSLWLPLAPLPMATAVPADQARGEHEIEGPTELTVLVVEDEDVVRAATERALRREGYRVTGAASVADALQYLGEGAPPDCIVSDVMMPGATGLDLLRTIRADGGDIPVVLVSGYPAEQLESELGHGRRVAFLAKPWTIEELRASIAGLLRPA